jgi:hypothetical protein
MSESTSLGDVRQGCCHDYHNKVSVCDPARVERKEYSEANPANNSQNNFVDEPYGEHRLSLSFESNPNVTMSGLFYGSQSTADLLQKVRDLIDPPIGRPGVDYNTGQEIIDKMTGKKSKQGPIPVKEYSKNFKEHPSNKEAEAAKGDKGSSKYSAININSELPENYPIADIPSRESISYGADLNGECSFKPELILKCIIGSLLLLAGLRVLPGASLEPAMPSVAGAGFYPGQNIDAPYQVL